MRNISSWAIRNPIFPLVLFAALTLLGLVSFMRMDVNDNPDIEFPAAVIIVSQPGAAPTEMETQVTQRIEAAVRGINGVDEISSTVGEGTSQTFVQFVIGTPVDRGVNDVRDAVANIRSDLPEGILEPRVQRVDIAGGPLGIYSAETRDMSLEQLSWYVDNTVAKRLLSVEGMSEVRRSGGVSREIRIILDPAKMQANGLTAVQVNAQLRQVNINAAGGRAEIAGSEQSVRVLGNAASAYALGETQISLPGGRTVKLSAIADVRDSYAEQRSLSTMNGRQVLSFRLTRAKGYSDVTVYEDSMKALEQLEKDNPKVKFTEMFTSVDYVKSQYHSAMEAMVEGAVLAVLVVLLFLRDWRATLISALAIPLSAIPTFWFMDLMGFSLNGLSLLALSLVAGVLVDDAIVEIENIVRHMRMGKSAYQASIDAADEIGLAVVATTFSIVAVFMPVGLMPGVSGQFFKNFGFTVVAAVLTSLAVARLITPLAAAYFLKAKGVASHGEGWMMDRYVGMLRWSLRNRWKTMLIGVAAFIATIFSFATLPMTFQPPLNLDFSQVQIEMPPGSTLERTSVVANKVSQLLRSKPEVEDAFADVNPTSAELFVTLKKDRERSSVEFERAYSPELQAIPDARINFQSQAGDGSGRDLNVTLVADDPAKMQQAAEKIIAEMRRLPEIRAPRINGELQRPEITITPRLDLAADLGVTTAALSQTIRIATLGDIDQNSAKFSLSDRQVPIRVALPQTSRRNLSTIENLPVPTANGGSVPLKHVAAISFGAGPSEVKRYNQRRRTAIGADLAPGVVTSDAMKKIEALPSVQNLPDGVEKVEVGAAKWQAELVQNFILAVIAGVFLVFAVLVLLYKRVLPPFVNMGSLLLAPLGGALALHLTGNPMSLPVMIGILMLLGIVAKNSILLIDFAIEEIGKGVPKDEAIVDAGHKRAQPIVMTTVAMVAGMLPIAMSFTGDGSWRAPMGVVVIGGLILSTVLTLVIVPAGFSLADSFEQWLGKRLRRVLTYQEPEEGGSRPEPQPAE
jgi:multidrug efflux pump subunit AcrB